MANTFLRKISRNIGTSLTAVDSYTVGANVGAVVVGLNISNTSSAQVTANIVINNGDANFYLTHRIPVAAGGAVSIAGGDQKIILQTGDSIKVNSSAASSVDVLMNIMETDGVGVTTDLYTPATLINTIDNPNAYGTSVNDVFGESISASGNYAIVGAYGEDEAGNTASGKAYIFNLTTGALVHTLNNPNIYDTPAYDNFGDTVAMNGDYALVTATAESNYSANVYVYNVNSGNLISSLYNPNANTASISDSFGWAAAIDGNTAIISAVYESDSAGSEGGKAYIFNLVSGNLIHTLDNPNPFGTSTYDQFGNRVAISGNVAVVGANYEDATGAGASGRAYIYNVTTGALVHTLNNPDPVTADAFGEDVAVDGNYVAIGCPGKNSLSGNVYIYNATTGSLIRTLTNPNPIGDSSLDSFGFTISMLGNYIAVSALGESDLTNSTSGKVYIFEIDTGDLMQTIDNPNAYGTSANDAFGNQISLTADHLVVGVPGEDDAGGTNSGKVYIYKR